VRLATTLWNPEIELLPRAELRELQWRRLQAQLSYNYGHSAFYRRRLDAAGFPPDEIRTWDDFRRIPPMDKHAHRLAQEESMEQFGHPFGLLSCAPLDSFVLLSSTSGTTGTPTFYTLTSKDMQVLHELQARKFHRAGLKPGDRVLHAFSLSMFTAGIPWVTALQQYGACVVPVGAEAGSRRILEHARLVKPRALTCTPSLAEFLIDKAPEIIGAPVRDLGLELIICAGEPGVGLREIRHRIEDAYGACVYDAIGSAHTFHGISCDAPEYEGMHFCSEDFCILELRDPETGEFLEVEDGVTGELVFTELEWEGTPLLRYAIGDIVQVFVSPCTCGRPGLRFKILGRSDDMLIVKGVNVYPAALRNVVVGFHPSTTGEMRVVLEGPGPRVPPPLRLIVEYGPSLAADGVANLRTSLEEAMHERLRVRPAIEMVAPGTLRRTTHKAKLIEVRASGGPTSVPADSTPPSIRRRSGAARKG
jgi:phenylacetate-CoA ligase